MQSRAHVKGHPIHPILVGFPVAFFTGTLVFDILAVLKDPAFFHTAFYLQLAGLVMAVIAAIPGLVDYIFTVPPKSSGKKRATQHALINTGVILLFTITFIYRFNVSELSPFILLVPETAGVILLGIAGWMGATLVYRNQIGVNPRYAGAGKWKEEYLSKENGRVEVKDTGTLKNNQMRLLHVNGKRIVIAKTETGYVAFDDYCPHKGGPLAGGAMICGTVQCPWHGSQFNVHTGNVSAGPAKEKIIVYPVEVVNDRLFIDLEKKQALQEVS